MRREGAHLERTTEAPGQGIGRPSRRILLVSLAAVGASADGVTWLGRSGVLSDSRRPHAVRRIGYMSGAYVESIQEAFQTGLREHGWIEGENLLIERRFYGDLAMTSANQVAELLDQHVEVLITFGSTATSAAKAATQSIPIVMLGVGDPVGLGLVSNLARPDANLTGNTYGAPNPCIEAAGTLERRSPCYVARRLPVESGNPGNGGNAREHHAAAAALGLNLQDVLVRVPEDIVPSFDIIRRIGADALRLLSETVFNQHKPEWLGFAASQRLPAMYQQLDWVRAGGLMAYLPDNIDLARRGGSYVDKILRGAKPGDLPIEQPTRYEFYLNGTTAQALGLNIPEPVSIQVTGWFQ
jgi:putative ABC transport system substrate-binding protein